MAYPKFLNAAPPPLDLNSLRGQEWMARMPDTLESIPNIMKHTALTNQNTSLSATAFQGFVLQAGLYRVSYHARITTPATTGAATSSLTVTIAWTDGTVGQSLAGAAMTGNTTTTRQSDVYLIRADASTNVTYATTYASNTASQMKYSLDLILEHVGD